MHIEILQCFFFRFNLGYTMKRTPLFSALCLSAFVLTGSALAKSTTPPVHKLGLTDVPTLRLGDGYFTYNKMSAGDSPLLGRDQLKVTYGDIQNTLNMAQTIDRDEMSQDLNVNVSASGGWGMFSASASANYMRHTENDEYTENFTYSERYYANASLDITSLPANTTGFTKVAADDYNQHGISGFTNRYGDTFIQQLPEGAFLLVNLRLHFTSALDKTNFDAAVGGSFGSIFSASAAIQSAVTKSHSHGEIEVSAYQLGGDPSKLANIFAKEAGGGYYITSCSLDDLKACKGAIDGTDGKTGIITYAQNDFSQQIKPNKVTGRVPDGNLAAVGEPFLATYHSKFNIDAPQPIDPSAITARLQLAEFYNTTKERKIFVDHLLASSVAADITKTYKDQLISTQSSLNWNTSLFDQYGAIHCWSPGEESQCSSIMSNIQAQARPIDKKMLDYFNTAYHKVGAVFIPLGGTLYIISPSAQWLGNITFNSDRSILHVTYHQFHGDLARAGDCYIGTIYGGTPQYNTICPVTTPV